MFFVCNFKLKCIILIMSSKVKTKHIESFLQDIQDFQFGEKQKFHLQQHLTPPNVAARLIYKIAQDQNLKQSIVADLGIGTGMLICGLIFLGAEHAIGVEIDQKYINIAQQMLSQKVEGASFELINADIKHLNIRQNTVDLVVMNPPFGTKQQGIDLQFLKTAMKICRGNVYSMHKTSTRPFLHKYITNNGYQFQVIQTIKFPLKKRFNKYHKKQVAYTEVDIIKLTRLKNPDIGQKRTEKVQKIDKYEQLENISQKLSKIQMKSQQQ